MQGTWGGHLSHHQSSCPSILLKETAEMHLLGTDELNSKARPTSTQRCSFKVTLDWRDGPNTSLRPWIYRELMWKDVTNEKSIQMCYKKGTYSINIVMETIQICLKGHSEHINERERTGPEPGKWDTAGSQNWSQSCSITRSRATCCLKSTSLTFESWMFWPWRYKSTWRKITLKELKCNHKNAVLASQKQIPRRKRWILNWAFSKIAQTQVLLLPICLGTF